MKTTRVGQILSKLLADKNLRVAELARLVNIPQPTLHRIATGVCEHPHLSSLQPIADFFAISVDQLKGLDLIPHLDQNRKIPLLKWDQIAHGFTNIANTKHTELVYTDAKVSPDAYAIHLEDASMDPVFPKGTLLIADPQRPPKDRSYVIAKLAKLKTPIFRQLHIDAQYFYLKPLSPALDRYKMTYLEENDSILSTVVQTKRNCED